MPDVVELRRYTLHPGRRDTLVELFDREFVEPQEAEGIRVLGQFRNLDDPDQFVWLRGFSDMEQRRHALATFYGGPAWQTHRDAANATMVDSDDVLLLRPVGACPGFPAPGTTRPQTAPTAGLLTATLYALRRPLADDVLHAFASEVEPLLLAAGGQPLALLGTEDAENTFPALPVREGDHHLVRLARHADPAALAAVEARLAGSAGWRDVADRFQEHLVGEPETSRLAPTGRSLLR